MIDKKKQGKKNRKKGSEWEKTVRADLESKGWIVSKWQNQVEFIDRIYCSTTTSSGSGGGIYNAKEGRLIPCRMNFRGKGIPMMLGAGFPDFIAYKIENIQFKSMQWNIGNTKFPVIIGVECKINGYLTPEEREKCSWLLDNNIFSKILIARKPKTAEELMMGEKIIYEEFLKCNQ